MALVARARRGALLRAHRHRLPWADLEDAYSQATLELLLRARRGEGFSDARHIANTLELRLLSRARDRRRHARVQAQAHAAIARALSGDGGKRGAARQAADRRADVERLAGAREELRRLARRSAALTPDQRLVLSSQIAGELDCAQFCARHGWRGEKYRKVAQRARARLREQDDVPSVRERRNKGQGPTYEYPSPHPT